MEYEELKAEVAEIEKSGKYFPSMRVFNYAWRELLLFDDAIMLLDDLNSRLTAEIEARERAEKALEEIWNELYHTDPAKRNTAKILNAYYKPED
ncbi:hypothetical protein M0R19_05480 [Candidatus Pacearchaeota archaeon]|jgi:hypothetical protein|nr:hypothetical protein [Candidatus Pacearchaeota archaeon]